jgi:hypothetical protein
MSRWISITYRSAQIIASLLPNESEHLSREAQAAVIEFLGEILRVKEGHNKRHQMAEEKDPDS